MNPLPSAPAGEVCEDGLGVLDHRLLPVIFLHGKNRSHRFPLLFSALHLIVLFAVAVQPQVAFQFVPGQTAPPASFIYHQHASRWRGSARREKKKQKKKRLRT